MDARLLTHEAALPLPDLGYMNLEVITIFLLVTRHKIAVLISSVPVTSLSGSGKAGFQEESLGEDEGVMRSNFMLEH